MEKIDILREYIKKLGSVAVAFSSGVDSTFLLKAAHGVLDGRCIAITAELAFVPEREIEETRNFCKTEGIRHIIGQ